MGLPDGVAGIRGSRELGAPCPCGQKAGHTVKQHVGSMNTISLVADNISQVSNPLGALFITIYI